MELEHGSKRLPILDRHFRYIERKRASDRLLFYIVLITLIVSLTYAFLLFNEEKKETVATSGGTLIEGIVGTPRFVNPVLAITRADQDIVALVYSGIMRLAPHGELEPDLASSVTISDDGLVYNIVLRDDVYFHDGTPVNAEDVAYTIALIQDPMLKSPLRGNWSDVVVEVIGEKELNIVLDEAYTPFVENLTIGILPKHVWETLSTEQLPFSQHNTEPIGSGPYQLGRVTHNSSGLIESYTLYAAEKGDETAKISTIKLVFYPNEEELIAGFDADEFLSTTAFSFEALNHIDKNEYQIVEEPLPRVFSIFFNQNKSPALRDEAVRQALAAALNRDEMVETVLHGYGVPTNSPVPPGFLPVELVDTSTTTPSILSATSGIRFAEGLLIDAGWKQAEDKSWQKEIDEDVVKLDVTITTTNTEVFENTASYIRSSWEALGVNVHVALFEQSDLVQASIRPRDYEALLFGAEVGRALDLYPFWHSSQRDDPGLNVALYTNITTDALLETARTTQDSEERTEAIRTFEEEISNEAPAIFLYSPSFTYVIDKSVSIPSMFRIVRPSERFADVQSWHMSESDVWSFFAN